jgi:ribosomal protein S18 acetylase RimI-like enzyme
VIEYRAFRNVDTPGIARLWNAQPPRRGLARPVSPRLLEELVFSKPYFERHGLIVASDADEIVGFAHGGFGPNEDESDISTEMGVICMLMVAERADATAIAQGLITECEAYLKGRGSRLIYAGCINPLIPFYLGLYGGSEMPGTLASDADIVDYYRESGYQEIDRCVVLQREIAGKLRKRVDHRQTHVRRRYRVEINRLDPPSTWWSACTAPPTDAVRLQLLPRQGGPPCGGLTLWTVEPLGRTWCVATAGLCDVEIPRAVQRIGLATFLNVEAIRYLQTSGMGLVEAQTMQQNTAARGLYEKLGFKQVDQGIVLRKS